MRSRFFRLWLIIIVLSGLLIQFPSTDHSSAQAEIVWLENEYESPLQTNIQSKGGKGSNVWDDKVYVPPPQRKQVRRHVPPPPKVPRLTFEWRILKCGPGGVETEVSPESIFRAGDRWRISIKTNQSGYLYVINQTEGPDGAILYGPKQILPDSRIDSGRHYVERDEPKVLPSGCPPHNAPCACHYQFNNVAGRELMIVIFSRELLTDLNDNRVSGDMIKQSYIAELKAKWERQKAKKEVRQTSKPNISPQQGGGAGRYAIWVTNYNLNDNETLIWMISLNNAGGASGN